MHQSTQDTPEAAELLQTVREALGLSVSQMAQAVGLLGVSGADNIRQMERGARPVSGPIHLLLRYMAPCAGVTLPPVPPSIAHGEAVRIRIASHATR